MTHSNVVNAVSNHDALQSITGIEFTVKAKGKERSLAWPAQSGLSPQELEEQRDVLDFLARRGAIKSLPDFDNAHCPIGGVRVVSVDLVEVRKGMTVLNDPDRQARFEVARDLLATSTGAAFSVNKAGISLTPDPAQSEKRPSDRIGPDPVHLVNKLAEEGHLQCDYDGNRLRILSVFADLENRLAPFSRPVTRRETPAEAIAPGPAFLPAAVSHNLRIRRSGSAPT